MRQEFNDCDANSDGRVSHEELQRLMRGCDNDWVDVFRSLNRNRDKEISFEEFKGFFSNPLIYYFFLELY